MIHGFKLGLWAKWGILNFRECRYKPLLLRPNFRVPVDHMDKARPLAIIAD